MPQPHYLNRKPLTEKEKFNPRRRAPVSNVLAGAGDDDEYR